MVHATSLNVFFVGALLLALRVSQRWAHQDKSVFGATDTAKQIKPRTLPEQGKTVQFRQLNVLQ